MAYEFRNAYNSEVITKYPQANVSKSSSKCHDISLENAFPCNNWSIDS